MKNFTIAALQMDVIIGDIIANLKKAQSLIEQASKYKPQIITLPEMFATGFDYPYLKRMAQENINDLTAFFINHSYKFGAYIVGGTVPEYADGRLYNTCFVSSPDRKIVGYQRKIHPFSMTEESKYFNGGDKLNLINTPIAKLGIVICYDIRFPEVARSLTLKGAELLICPAQFPSPRDHHWEIMLKSRAIEDQVFVVGNNRVGGRKTRFFGRSMAVDPYGDVLEELDDKEGIMVANIDLDRIEKVREHMPVLLDRKPEAYK